MLARAPQSTSDCLAEVTAASPTDLETTEEEAVMWPCQCATGTGKVDSQQATGHRKIPSVLPSFSPPLLHPQALPRSRGNHDLSFQFPPKYLQDINRYFQI